MITTYTVTGMTCGNCAHHVHEEVSEIDGVKAVNVDLDGASMTVESDSEIDFASIEAAVAEAGDKYSVARA